MTTRFRDLLGTFLTYCSAMALGLGLLLLTEDARADDPLDTDDFLCQGCDPGHPNACVWEDWDYCWLGLCVIQNIQDPPPCVPECLCYPNPDIFKCFCAPDG